MIDIKYFVRTMEGRTYNIPIKHEKIIDYERKYVKSYIDALYKINDFNSVLLEDDIILCNNFKEEVAKVINKYPRNIINFFSNPSKYYTTHFTNVFGYNQCTYFPKGLSKKLADKMNSLYLDENTHPRKQKYGALLNIALLELNIPHLVYRPCLVQHIDVTSTRNKVTNNRNTIYFKDYLDRLNIDMLQAYEKHNQELLQKMLDEDRKTWYKIYKSREEENK